MKDIFLLIILVVSLVSCSDLDSGFDRINERSINFRLRLEVLIN